MYLPAELINGGIAGLLFKDSEVKYGCSSGEALISKKK